MSTTSFESDTKRIEAPQRSVFEKLSNADNLEKLKERIPADKLDNISLDNGMLTFKTPMGAVSMQSKDTEPFHSVTYGTVQSPIPFDIRMELIPKGAEACEMKLIAGLQLNPFMLGMVQKPIKDGLNRIVEALAQVPY